MLIFNSDRDYCRFQSLLYLSNGTQPVVFRDIEKDSVYDFDRGEVQVHIGAYCLMPNHFHLLLTPSVDNGIQNFLQKLSTSYSMYFNKKYERTGVLFEGRFKSRHVVDDRYLKYLFSYIHLNPVKLLEPNWKEQGILDSVSTKQYLEGYHYSSFLDYARERRENVILDKAVFPAYFVTKTEIDAEILEWLSYDSEAKT